VATVKQCDNCKDVVQTHEAVSWFEVELTTKKLGGYTISVEVCSKKCLLEYIGKRSL
jgi:hypothetical protein